MTGQKILSGQSLPLWERGLKLSTHMSCHGTPESLPLWERGLKCPCLGMRSRPLCVAPFVGAWIEIEAIDQSIFLSFVAPFVGAWIEITGRKRGQPLLTSLPLWERGLKFLALAKSPLSVIVAPFVGAWIEIQRTGGTDEIAIVAPFVGAWIEIGAIDQSIFYPFSVAPFVGAWIEILQIFDTVYTYVSLPLWERGLK